MEFETQEAQPVAPALPVTGEEGQATPLLKLGDFEEVVLLAVHKLERQGDTAIYGMKVPDVISAAGRPTGVYPVYSALERLATKGYLERVAVDAEVVAGKPKGKKGANPRHAYRLAAWGLKAMAQAEAVRYLLKR